MLRRLIDGVEPEIVDEAAEAILTVDGVEAVEDLRVRWHGHQLRIAASVAVDAQLTVKRGMTSPTMLNMCSTISSPRRLS